MKIKIELGIDEMDRMHEAMLETAEELELRNVPDSLFVKRRKNLKSIKIDQRIGELDIDVDSKFVVWCIDRLMGFVKFIKPVTTYFGKIINELSDWITPIDQSEEDIQTEFDV